jgi:hypothetical protein
MTLSKFAEVTVKCDKVGMNSKVCKDCNEVMMAYFKMLFWNVPGRGWGAPNMLVISVELRGSYSGDLQRLLLSLL